MKVGDRVRLSASAQIGATLTEGTITSILSSLVAVRWDNGVVYYCSTADLELVPTTPAIAFYLGDKVRLLSSTNGSTGEVIAIGCNHRAGQYEVRWPVMKTVVWYWDYELILAPPATPPNQFAAVYRAWIGPRSEDVKVKPYACDRCFGSKEIAVCMPCPKCC